MPFSPGTRIGRIRVDALLGTGGMGEVYRGWDEKLERAVALKVVHADKRLSSAIRGRFLREARVLSQLDHPHICRIYDVLEREDGDYLVLELVDGTTLRELIATMPKAQALDITLQVARVLATTHARGIVHRDLKPDNIMLTPSGNVKVLDFGLARSVDPAQQAHAGAEPEFLGDDYEKTAVLGRPASTTAGETKTSVGSLVGTLQYMSPEQARGLPLNEASDIYSLGIVLRELLTRDRNAYGDVEAMTNLLVRVRQASVDLTAIQDAALATLLKRMLALYPADHPTAEDVVRELERIRERPARMRRRITAVGAVLLALLVVTSIVLLVHNFAPSHTLFARKAAAASRSCRFATRPAMRR